MMKARSRQLLLQIILLLRLGGYFKSFKSAFLLFNIKKLASLKATLVLNYNLFSLNSADARAASVTENAGR